jgi:hypothetical protein
VQVTVIPPVFPAADGFEIMVVGGTPPFTFTPLEVPPNPPGVQVSPSGAIADVTVPGSTPPLTYILVKVTDSSTPPVERTARARVG